MDVSLGLRRVMGQESLYIAMLRRFVAGQKNAANDVRRLMRKGDSESAQRLAHNAKSISGIIGALQLQEHAASLERAIRQRQSPDAIDTSLAVFETTLAEIIAAIESSLSPEPAPPVEDANQEALTSIVEKLAALLADDNTEASCLFAKYSELMQRSFGDDFPSLQAAIDGFDFDTAASLLERARKKTAV